MNKQEIADPNNNKFILTYENNLIKIVLKLVNEKFNRNIGTVILSERKFQVRRIKSKHLFLKSNSYGFNWHIISNTTRFDKVLLIDDDGEYLIPRQVILDKAKFMNFKQQGFELQKFLSLEIIKKYKIRGF